MSSNNDICIIVLIQIQICCLMPTRWGQTIEVAFSSKVHESTFRFSFSMNEKYNFRHVIQ